MAQVPRKAEFGDVMFLLDFVINGHVPRNEVKAVAASIIKAIDMEACYTAAEWHYPLNGKGGEGVTLVQPLTESFIAIDTYPTHAFVFIKSCKPFNPVNAYYAVVAHSFGYAVGDYRAVQFTEGNPRYQ